MDRDPDLYRRNEFGWFLGALTFGMAVASALPVPWWAKLLLGVALALGLLPLLGWLSRPLGRVLRFLLIPVVPLREDDRRSSDLIMRGTSLDPGGDSADLEASRILIEFAPGDVHVHAVMLPGTDPVPKLHETVKSLDRHVESVRALRGWDEVARWRPSLRSKIAHAWRRAR